MSFLQNKLQWPECVLREEVGGQVSVLIEVNPWLWLSGKLRGLQCNNWKEIKEILIHFLMNTVLFFICVMYQAWILKRGFLRLGFYRRIACKNNNILKEKTEHGGRV